MADKNIILKDGEDILYPKTTLSIDRTLTIPTEYFQLGLANDNKAMLMSNSNASSLVNEINNLSIENLLKFDKFKIKLSLNGNIMEAVFRKKYSVFSSNNKITTNYFINVTFLLLGILYSIDMELQFWNIDNTLNTDYSWCRVHIIEQAG